MNRVQVTGIVDDAAGGVPATDDTLLETLRVCGGARSGVLLAGGVALTVQVVSFALLLLQGIGEVLNKLLFKIVDNPVSAIMNGNFIGILVWGVAIGLTMRHASESSRQMLADLSHAITLVVRVVIRLAPIGIFGLVAGNLAEFGFSTLRGYAQILTVLLTSMVFMALNRKCGRILACRASIRVRASDSMWRRHW